MCAQWPKVTIHFQLTGASLEHQAAMGVFLNLSDEYDIEGAQIFNHVAF